jgi:hypothetical protein
MKPECYFNFKVTHRIIWERRGENINEFPSIWVCLSSFPPDLPTKTKERERERRRELKNCKHKLKHPSLAFSLYGRMKSINFVLRQNRQFLKPPFCTHVYSSFATLLWSGLAAVAQSGIGKVLQVEKFTCKFLHVGTPLPTSIGGRTWSQPWPALIVAAAKSYV